jgi:hypothetical protein
MNVDRVQMARDLVEVEMTPPFSFVDPVHQQHQFEPVLLLPMSIVKLPSVVTGNDKGVLATARHHHNLCTC